MRSFFRLSTACDEMLYTTLVPLGTSVYKICRNFAGVCRRDSVSVTGGMPLVFAKKE
jgi:hypothetical protein